MKWKRRFWSLVNLKQLRGRFFITMIVVAMLPLIALGIFSYHISKDTIETNYVTTNQDQLSTSSQVADLLLEDVIELHRLILSDNRLQQELRNGSTGGGEGEVIGYESTLRMQEIISNYLIEQNHIASVCLYDNQLRAACSGRSNNLGVYQSNPDQVKNEDWYRQMTEAEGKEVFLPYDVLSGRENGETFSSVKHLLDPDNFDRSPIGFLVINLDKEVFEESMQESEESEFMVLAPDDGSTQMVAGSADPLETDSGPRNIEDVTAGLEEDGYMVTSHMNSTTGWHLVKMIESRYLLRDSRQIGTATLILVLVISVLVITASAVMSKSITRPLNKIKAMLLAWSLGQRKFTTTFKNDEVGMIGNTFKAVSAENEKLNQRLLQSRISERESRLHALQAQINPHFLYNVLDSMYWKAALQNNDDVAQMAVSLSENFKMILSQHGRLIPIRQELQHVQHYLTIQNIRYNDRFTFTEQIDESLYDENILKLLLQPMIENAIYHGLEPKMGEGTITLEGYWDGDYIVFAVTDDGVGFEYDDTHKSGIGMRNVRERLEYSYDTHSFFHVDSTLREGTKITFGYVPGKESIQNESDNY